MPVVISSANLVCKNAVVHVVDSVIVPTPSNPQNPKYNPSGNPNMGGGTNANANGYGPVPMPFAGGAAAASAYIPNANEINGMPQGMNGMPADGMNGMPKGMDGTPLKAYVNNVDTM
eukprot:gb/GEZN01028117.1/.p1 GENE.gb/GEZN01028117.1/~~gb/GEZN01028117.1/.p1  ORF type:complete len:117 (-),score=7.95 gb/GEZN01028117.1/:46-396(-)